MTRQCRPAGTSRKPAAAGGKISRKGAKTLLKLEDLRLKQNPKRVVREKALQLTTAWEEERKLPRECHDLLFKIILFNLECLKILLRLALPKEDFDRINFNIDPVYLDRVYDEWGEPKVVLDGAVLLTLDSGLYMQITLEHKSTYNAGTQFQVVYNTFRAWKGLFNRYDAFKDNLPEAHALVVLHGRGADRHPPSIQALCGIADKDSQSSFYAPRVTLFDGRNATIEDFGPAIHGGIVFALLHSHKRPLCDAGIRYLAEAATDSPDGQAIEAYALGELDISSDRWQAAMIALSQAQQKEYTMGPLATGLLQEGRAEGRAEGRTEGMAESVLKVLETRFGPVPGTIEERIYAAEDSELDRLLGKVGIVPSVDALFNGYGGD